MTSEKPYALCLQELITRDFVCLQADAAQK